jgi:hypothetical protein
VAVLEPSKPVSPSDIDSQLQKLNAELDSQANSTAATQPGSLVNKAMEVRGSNLCVCVGGGSPSKSKGDTGGGSWG